MEYTTVKCRIYPKDKQKKVFDLNFECCVELWNIMLQDRIDYYNKTKKALLNMTPAKYKRKYPKLKEADSTALLNTYINLNEAYMRFFNKSAGFPKFKRGYHIRKTYTTNNANDSIFMIDGRIRLPKVGFVKIKLHRKIKEDWSLQKVTVILDADGKYYASLIYAFEPKHRNYILATNNAVGLDYKSNAFYTDSKGNVVSIPRFDLKFKSKLKIMYDKLHKKVCGSSNYKKQLKKISRILHKIANQRLDFLHKITTKLADRWDIITVESCDMDEIASLYNHHNTVINHAWGKTRDMLEYKMRWRQKWLVRADRFFASSQICSKCGHRHRMDDLDVREYVCQECGLIIDRDKNAAINLENYGIERYIDFLGDEYR